MNALNGPALGIILKGYPRISETFISNEIQLLEGLGLFICLYSMRHPREPFSHESVKEIKASVDYLPETLLLPLPRYLYHNLLLATQRPGPYARTLRLALGRLLHTKKLATIKHLLQAGYLVHHLLPGRGVRHLHAHFAHSPASVALFASQLSGLPFSFTAHAKDIYTSDPTGLRQKIGLASFVVTCTEYNKRYLTSLSQGHSARIYRIYHGINLDLFSNKTEATHPSAPYQVLTIARLTAKKGLPTVYRALRHLCDRGIPLHHTLIGDGEDRGKIMSLIKELRLDPVTECLGTQPHQVVLEYYRKADLFVLGCEVASNGDRDGIPNVFLESMAMGVPVVATRVSAIPELVDDEQTGLLVPPGRPEKMADAMVRLLTEKSLRQRIIPAARERVIKDFDNRMLIGDLAALYRKAGL